MALKQPKVAINLIVYNGQDYLKPCLESVLAQSYPNISIYIVDNNSTDSSAQILNKFKQDNDKIELILSQKNLGFAVAHNLLIKKSSSDFVCALNQDVVLDKEFIKNAVKALEDDDKIAAVQGKLLRLSKDQAKLDIIDTTGLVMLKNRRIIARGQGESDHGQYNKQEEIFGVDGAAPVYRRVALENVKINNEYFDEEFFMYKEDVDLAWRLQLYGWHSICQPTAIGWHARSAGDSAATGYLDIVKERLKISKFAKYLAFKNQRLMQLKNEQPTLLLRHALWFLPKEIGSWLYVLLFERYTYQAIKELLRQAPSALAKRKIVMKGKTVQAFEMAKWFK